MLDNFGPDGMSDDESDREGIQISSRPDYRLEQHLPRFHVVVPAWRAQVVTQWLAAIDTLYVKLIRSSKLRGSFPHIRERSDSCVNWAARCVKGLPVNAYDTMWLVGKDQKQINVLNEQYDFGLNVGEIMSLYL